MKVWTLVPLAVVALGCHGVEPPAPYEKGLPPVTEKANTMPTKADATALKETEKFGDEVFVVPSYPGAEHSPYTALEMDAGTSHTYARHFSTPDDLDKVETFIKSEGEKLGKYSNPAKGVFNEKLIRNGNIDLPDGKKFIFKLMRDDKGAKTDIMYNISVPKK